MSHRTKYCERQLSIAAQVFFPGSMQQVCVGLLGAMFSFAVHNHERAYIEDDDDVVSSVAEAQLVYTSSVALRQLRVA